MSDTQGGMPAPAPVHADQVIDLNHHRIRQLERDLADTRRRLEKLERKRLRAAVKMGRLQRKLACGTRELQALRDRLARHKPDARA